MASMLLNPGSGAGDFLCESNNTSPARDLPVTLNHLRPVPEWSEVGPHGLRTAPHYRMHTATDCPYQCPNLQVNCLFQRPILRLLELLAVHAILVSTHTEVETMAGNALR